ncbi:MAG: hypothetical protein R3B57_12525 [Phycisphaerales bacterium]
MTDIRRVLKAAGARLFLIDLLKTLTLTLTLALFALVLVRIAQKLAPLELSWTWVASIAGGAALVVALAWSAMRRDKDIDIAREVDERAGLRESISTALCVEREEGAWSRVVVEQAQEKAKRVNVREAIPVTTPRLWPAVLAGAIALACVWWLPSYDLGGLFARKEAKEAQQREVREVLGEVKSGQKRLEDLLSDTSVKLTEDEADKDPGEGDQTEATKAEELRREAIKKLTNLSDRIKKAQDSGEARKMEALKQALNKLREPTDSPATEFSRQLAKGNFSEAKQELEKMAEQLSADELSEPEKKALKQQLDSLAQQMQQLAESREALEQQLQDAGLTKEQAQQAARDPSQLEQMLQNMPGIPSDMAAQMRQMADAQQSASESLQSMSQSLQQMAQNMSQDQSGQQSQDAQQAMQSMADQLSQMEMSQQESESFQAAMNEIQDQLDKMGQGDKGDKSGNGKSPGDGQGQWDEGDSLAKNDGSGGPGQGWGPSPDAEAVDYILDKQKEKVENHGGPTIGSTLVYGDQIRGESVAQFEAATTAARAEAAEAIETKRIPREYEKAIQHYFGRLEARAKAKRAAEEAASSNSSEGGG